MKTKTVTCHGYIVFDALRARHPDIWPDGGFTFQTYKPDGAPDQTLVREHEISFEAPEDFDPRPGMVAALEKKKEQARAEFAALVVSIDRQISELTAIEYTPEAA